MEFISVLTPKMLSIVAEPGGAARPFMHHKGKVLAGHKHAWCSSKRCRYATKNSKRRVYDPVPEMVALLWALPPRQAAQGPHKGEWRVLARMPGLNLAPVMKLDATPTLQKQRRTMGWME